MSYVTDIILSVSIDDTKGPESLNKYLFDEHHERQMNRVDIHAGGNKAVQCDIFMAAINYLNIKQFLDVFYDAEWEIPECVQLMLKEENEDVFIVYTP